MVTRDHLFHELQVLLLRDQMPLGKLTRAVIP